MDSGNEAFTYDTRTKLKTLSWQANLQEQASGVEQLRNSLCVSILVTSLPSIPTCASQKVGFYI